MKFRYVNSKEKNYIINLFDNPIGLLFFPFCGVYKTMIYPVKFEWFSDDISKNKKSEVVKSLIVILGIVIGQRLDFLDKYSRHISFGWAIILFMLFVLFVELGLFFLSKKTIVNYRITGVPTNVEIRRKPKYGVLIVSLMIIINVIVINEAVRLMVDLNFGSICVGLFCSLIVCLSPFVILACSELEYEGELLKLISFNKK